MALGQAVVAEIDRLKRMTVAELLALPAMSEQQVEIDGKAGDLHVYREGSHDGRTVVIVKAFTPRLIGTNAAAEGFAITKSGALVDLDHEERTTLY